MITQKFKDEAKKFNLYLREDVPSIYLKDQILNGSKFNYSYRIERDEKANVLPDLILSSFEHGLFYECRVQFKNFTNEPELYYIEHSYILFLTPKGRLAMIKHHKGKYHFSPYYGYFRQWQQINYHVRNEAIEKAGLKEPNKIGVFSVKKIAEWLNYCDQYIDLMIEYTDSVEHKNKDIEKQIQGYIDSIGGRVDKWQNTTEISKDNFRITLTHYKESQYLDVKIVYSGNINDVIGIIGK